MSEKDDDNRQEALFADVTWREPLGAFATVVVCLLGISLLATALPVVSDLILAVAAVVFIAVPFIILRRRGADFHRFGIDLERIPLRHVGWGIVAIAVVFPLYAVGHHLWEVHVVERQFEPAADNYRQWSVELDVPSLAGHHDELIQVRTVAGRLYVEWSGSGRSSTLVATADRAFSWHPVGGLSAHHGDKDWIDAYDEHPSRIKPGHQTAPSTAWVIAPTTGDGRLVLSPLAQPEDGALPNRLTLSLWTADNEEPPEFLVGTRSEEPEEDVELRRDYWWIVLWALTHLILVAFPEEYFYRGYLQTRLSDLFGDSTEDAPPRTFLGFTRANWATSALFAAGHVLVPVGGIFSPARAAVFFPSLIFGWLRTRTGSIIAPTIFHAGANMMVLLLAVHYF